MSRASITECTAAFTGRARRHQCRPRTTREAIAGELRATCAVPWGTHANRASVQTTCTHLPLVERHPVQVPHHLLPLGRRVPHVLVQPLQVAGELRAPFLAQAGIPLLLHLLIQRLQVCTAPCGGRGLPGLLRAGAAALPTRATAAAPGEHLPLPCARGACGCRGTRGGQCRRMRTRACACMHACKRTCLQTAVHAYTIALIRCMLNAWYAECARTHAYTHTHARIPACCRRRRCVSDGLPPRWGAAAGGELEVELDVLQGPAQRGWPGCSMGWSWLAQARSHSTPTPTSTWALFPGLQVNNIVQKPDLTNQCHHGRWQPSVSRSRFRCAIQP